MTIPLRQIFARTHQAITEPAKGEPWDRVEAHAIDLSVLCRRLVTQVHTLNEAREAPEDLCPLCAGYTWGRPRLPEGVEPPMIKTHAGLQPDVLDYTRRMCRECGEVRPEPEVPKR